MNTLIFSALICICLFFFAGGGSLLDKWIDGARGKWFAVIEIMPDWSLKVLRFASYIIYAAFLVFVLFLIVNE